MSIQLAQNSAWQKLLNSMLPQDCGLCSGPATNELLCDGCLGDLPRLPTTCCPICALPTPNSAICGACQNHPPHFDATHAAFIYDFPLDRLIQALKYGHQLAFARLFARLMLAHADDGLSGDLLLAVPLSKQRLATRGFNQSLELGRPLAHARRTPLNLHDVVRISDSAAQASLPWKERRANIRHAFECTADLSGKSVIVVDDVMTTGATLDEFARTLKLQGATRVTNWVLARTLKQ